MGVLSPCSSPLPGGHDESTLFDPFSGGSLPPPGPLFLHMAFRAVAEGKGEPFVAASSSRRIIEENSEHCIILPMCIST